MRWRTMKVECQNPSKESVSGMKDQLSVSTTAQEELTLTKQHRELKTEAKYMERDVGVFEFFPWRIMQVLETILHKIRIHQLIHQLKMKNPSGNNEKQREVIGSLKRGKGEVAFNRTRRVIGLEKCTVGLQVTLGTT